jgi:hypothetical protein
MEKREKSNSDLYAQVNEEGAILRGHLHLGHFIGHLAYRPKQKAPPSSSALLSPRLLPFGKRGCFCAEAAVGGGKKTKGGR